MLSYDYLKNEGSYYKRDKVKYENEKVIKLKKSLLNLDEGIMYHLNIKSHDEDFLPSALILLLNDLRNVWAKDIYNSDENHPEKLEGEELEEFISTMFTPFDLVLNPLFEFELIKCEEKIPHLKQSLIIEGKDMKK